MRKMTFLIFLLPFLWGIFVGYNLNNYIRDLRISADLTPIDVSDGCAEAWNYLVDTYPGFPIEPNLGSEEPSEYVNDLRRFESICSEEEIDRIIDEFERIQDIFRFQKWTGQYVI